MKHITTLTANFKSKNLKSSERHNLSLGRLLSFSAMINSGFLVKKVGQQEGQQALK
jgi:hypothetical protein